MPSDFDNDPSTLDERFDELVSLLRPNPKTQAEAQESQDAQNTLLLWVKAQVTWPRPLSSAGRLISLLDCTTDIHFKLEVCRALSFLAEDVPRLATHIGEVYLRVPKKDQLFFVRELMYSRSDHAVPYLFHALRKGNTQTRCEVIEHYAHGLRPKDPNQKKEIIWALQEAWKKAKGPRERQLLYRALNNTFQVPVKISFALKKKWDLGRPSRGEEFLEESVLEYLDMLETLLLDGASGDNQKDLLTFALNHKDPRIQVRGAQIAQDIEHPTTGILQSLLSLLALPAGEETTPLKKEVMKALGRYQDYTSMILPRLTPFLKSEDNELKQAALKAYDSLCKKAS